MAKIKKSNFIKRFFGKISYYFAGVIHQSKKVRWPNRAELIKNTIIVLSFATFFALYLNFCNIVIIWMFRALGLNI